MAWIETHIQRLETRLENLYRRILELEQKTAAALDKARAAGQQQGGGDGGGSSGGYFDCLLTSALNAGSTTTGDVSRRTGSSRVTAATGATLYNDGPSNIASGKTVILAPNGDGSYTAIGVYC